jgi:hypothetical protein
MSQGTHFPFLKLSTTASLSQYDWEESQKDGNNVPSQNGVPVTCRWDGVSVTLSPGTRARPLFVRRTPEQCGMSITGKEDTYATLHGTARAADLCLRRRHATIHRRDFHTAIPGRRSGSCRNVVRLPMLTHWLLNRASRRIKMVDHPMDTPCTNDGEPATAPGRIPTERLSPWNWPRKKYSPKLEINSSLTRSPVQKQPGCYTARLNVIGPGYRSTRDTRR